MMFGATDRDLASYYVVFMLFLIKCIIVVVVWSDLLGDI